MKKAVILFALLLAGAFALTACGGDNNSSETPSGQVEMETKKATEKATEKPTQKPTEKPTKKATEKPTEKKKDDKNSSSSSSGNSDNNSVEEQYEIIYEEVYDYPQEEQPQEIVEPQAPQEQPQQPQTPQTPQTGNNRDDGPAPSKDGTFVETDIAVKYGNATVVLDGAFSSIKSKLGSPDSTQENPNCGLSDNGKGYVYVYGNMTINTYFKNNKEYVETIFVESNGNARTTKKIGIGSSAADIKKKYGNPAAADDMVIQYNAGDKIMMFYIENGKVTGMFIGR